MMRPSFKKPHSLLPYLALPLLFMGAGKIDWRDMLESDWIYAMATRFSQVDGGAVHYPTPTAELARLLEGRAEAAALRHLADTKLELGDRSGAWAAMSNWAGREGASAWRETARWAFAHNYIPEAFQSAEKAIPGLDPEDKRALCDELIRWADLHPNAADPIALMKKRSELFPGDADALEEWLRRLEGAKRLDEADAALASTKALDAERRLLLRSDLAADRKKYGQAFKILDDAVLAPRSIEYRRAYATRVDRGEPGKPGAWRAQLETAFDAPALTRLCTWFQGKGRGDAATDLLRQMELRYGQNFGRDQYLLLGRLYAEVDAIPEAFRATMGAAQLGDSKAQLGDLARLGHLALQSGSRPLSIGVYNDEPYRWAAQIDRTPGFWTGAISFFLTGANLEASLDQLEAESLSERVFATAAALAGELARRSPQHPDLPALRVALMARHADRGEGEKAWALLPLLENTPSAGEARKIALTAARQANVPIREELRLMKARLRDLAPDNSRPTLGEDSDYSYGHGHDYDGSHSWKRIPRREKESYSDALSEYTQRLDYLDRSHRTSMGLILGEMDRMPGAEALWLHLSDQLESWRLDDDLGPRYLQALQRFKGEGVWPRLARWYAKRSYNSELKELAASLTQTFRGAEIFARIHDGDIRLAAPEQPPIRDGVRMVPWADWVRFKALERFPHSPMVVNEAQRLVTQSAWRSYYLKAENGQKDRSGPVVIPDNLMQAKRWAIFFVDPGIREPWFQEAMKDGNLEKKLEAIEAREQKTPVDDMILCEGWQRLSRFERAVDASSRLSSAYPGDEGMAVQTLSLYRSLSGLGHDHAKAAHALVARAAPALEFPYGLWTELGEMEEELGRPASAIGTWQKLIEREPRNLARISDLATLLWDYNHDREALKVIEEGRKRLGKPSALAFEAGVLCENLRNIDRAMEEYLVALRPGGNGDDGGDDGGEYGHAGQLDQRALSRIAQLLSRQRVYDIVEKNIQSLRPGQADSEKRLLGYFPLTLESAGLLREGDDWIDLENSPNDPVGREMAAQKRNDARPAVENAMRRMTDIILAKAENMASKATGNEFLEACRTWVNRSSSENWKPDRLVSFENMAMARRAELATSPEERIRLEIERADFLTVSGRGDESDAVWSQIEALLAPLPNGVEKMKLEAARASFLERSGDMGAAAAEWRRLGELYPWSFGLLEDRLAFLGRAGANDERRAILEDASNRAAEGFRLPLLQQLARLCLSENDDAKALVATRRILQESGLGGDDRLEAVEMLTRLSIRGDRAWEPAPFAKEQVAMFGQDNLPDMYRRVATAADSEGAHKMALWMWVEALNRRLDRQWLQSACRSAMAGGVGKELLSHFERQQQRSPRDVRWAVAVRDVRRNMNLVDETIRAAKDAVSINPGSEDLWREAAEILALADRAKDAADYLEGWHKPRSSDEGVAATRSRLYARAGEAERALAVERATLEAFQRNAAQNAASNRECENRRARAATRLLEYGFASQALRVYSQQGDILAVVGSEVPRRQQVRLAMYTGQLIKLLGASRDDEDMLGSIASELDDGAKVEDREAVLGYLLPQLLVPLEDRAAALKRWGRFTRNAGLGGALRLACAQGYVSGRPGPWQSNPSVPFLQSVGSVLLPDRYNYNSDDIQEPDLEWLWALDLARRDRPEELFALMQPAWVELMEAVFGNSGSDAASSQFRRKPGSPLLLETWARAASQKPETTQQLNNIMGDRQLWGRFQELVPQAWRDEQVLMGLVTPETRAAFCRFVAASQSGQGLRLQSRLKQATEAEQKKEDDVAMVLGRLILNGSGAADEPIIAKLRGPQTIGDLLSNDVQWLWPEFSLDQGSSKGSDAGRFPEAIWGQNPSEPWYVLEALVRYRKGDRTAPLLPLESAAAGSETERTMLALDIAKSMGDAALALELDAQRPGQASARRAQARIQLLNAAGEPGRAAELWKTHIASRQKTIDSAELSDLAQFAKRNGLPDVLGQLDASQPLHPELMATLVNANLAAFGSYKTSDVHAFRYALAMRWLRDEAGLDDARTRFWLRELWATGSFGLPDRGLKNLGGLWPHAHQWLSQQPLAKRVEAIEAVVSVGSVGSVELLGAAGAGGDALIKLLRQTSQSEQNDANQMLLARAYLAMGDAPSALSLLDRWIKDNGHGDLALSSRWQGNGEDDGEQYHQYDRPLVDGIGLWADVFGSGGARADALGRLSGMLKGIYENGPISGDAWALALDLCAPEARPALLKSLDRSWFMGQVEPDDMGALAKAIAKYAPKSAPLWLKRWTANNTLRHAKQRASVYMILKQPKDAAKVYIDARQRTLWGAADDWAAFNEWRRLDAGQAGPELWQSALKFWKGNSPISLAGHLKAHPLDCFSAASLLETPKGASEDDGARAEQSLRPFISDDGVYALLRLKAARHWLPTSWRTAAWCINGGSSHGSRADDYLQPMKKLKPDDANGAMADLARIYRQSGDKEQTRAALLLLQDRNYSGINALWAELDKPLPEKIVDYRMANGRPAPIMPKDLTWALLEKLMEGKA
jgi:hypothetical protein